MILLYKPKFREIYRNFDYFHVEGGGERVLFFVKGNKIHSFFLIRHCALAVLLAHLLITFKLGGREDKG